jgi:hypothetical protein
MKRVVFQVHIGNISFIFRNNRNFIERLFFCDLEKQIWWKTKWCRVMKSDETEQIIVNIAPKGNFLMAVR